MAATDIQVLREFSLIDGFKGTLGYRPFIFRDRISAVITQGVRLLFLGESSMGHDSRVHYHIHWTGKAMDWERFVTKAEAEESARQLALPGEYFAVEEHGESCPQCMAMMKKISAPGKSASA